MRPAIHFDGSSLSSLVQEVSQFLEKQKLKLPKFDGLLFCVDGELIEHLEDKSAFHSFLSGAKRVPRGLFRPPSMFEEEFERCKRGDWMHLKMYGILEGKALLGIQSARESPYIPPSPVKVALTKFEQKPSWVFEKN